MATGQLTVPLTARIAGTDVQVGTMTFTEDGGTVIATEPAQVRLAKTVAAPHIPRTT